MKDLTLREFQTNLPWTIRYSRDFRASPMSHKDFTHSLHHVSKAAGKLHALADDMDHDREVANDPTLRERHAKYIADLVVCALRLANTFPGGVIDLQAEVHARIEGKNGVKLTFDRPRKIIVNGTPFHTDAEELNYEDLAEIALGSRDADPTITFRGPGGSGGILSRGQTLHVTNDLVVNAVITGDA